MTSYERLAERLIETQRTVIGKRAVDIARSVDGLSITDDGAVEAVVGDEHTVLDDLVRSYVDVMGDSARTRLTDVASEYDDLTLPETLGGPSADEDATDASQAANESITTDGEATAEDVDDAVTAAEDGTAGEDMVTDIWGDDATAETETADPSPIDVVEGSLATIYVNVTSNRGQGPVPVGQLIVDAVLAETDLEPDELEHLSAYVSADEVVTLAEDDDRSGVSFSIEGYEVRLGEDGSVTVE